MKKSMILVLLIIFLGFVRMNIGEPLSIEVYAGLTIAFAVLAMTVKTFFDTIGRKK